MALTKLRPHVDQSSLYRTTCRFPVVVAGRGSGKTDISRRRLRRALLEHVPGNDKPMYFYGLPTYNQARRVAFKELKAMIPNEWLVKPPSETSMVFETKFGSELHVLGFDKPQRFEGNQWVGGIVDESSDQRPGLFDLTIRPALTHWNGWCWRIGVPKRFGRGAKDFKKAFEMGLTGRYPDMKSFTWASSSVLTADELAAIRASMDEKDFNEQYNASWETAGGLVFHQFKDSLHVNESFDRIANRAILIGSDFNVSPMCWCLAHLLDNNTIRVFDEIAVRNTNTNETLIELHNRIGDYQHGLNFFGDATGQANKTSASASDYIQILNSPLFTNKNVYYPKSNPLRVNRFAACNARLRDANKQVHIQIHPRCKRLIDDLNHRSYKPDTGLPDDKGDLGHMSDAFGYIIYKLFPLKIHSNVSSPIVITNTNA